MHALDELPNVPPSRKKKVAAVTFIFGAYFFETICFNSLQSDLFDYLVIEYKWSLESAASAYSTLAIIIGFMGAVGGILGDFVLHRFLLIILSYLFYSFGIIGLLLLQLNSKEQYHPSVPVLCRFNYSLIGDQTPNCYPFVMMMVVLIGLGTGITRVIIIVIAADQVRCYGARTVSVTIFSIYSVGELGMLLVHMIQPFINWHLNQKSVIWFLLFLFILLSISGGCIVLSRPILDMRRSRITPLSLFKTLKSMYKCHQRKSTNEEPFIWANVFERTKSYLHWEADDHVETVKRLFYAFLIFFCILPMSMLNSMEVYRIVQCLHMNVPKLGIHTFKNWTAPVEFFVILSTLVFLVASFRLLDSNDVFDYFHRICVGTVAAILATVYAGVMESIRLVVFWGFNNPSTTPRGSVIWHKTDIKSYAAANMSVFLLLPSFLLMGLSKILVLVTCMEYMYLSVPPWLQTSTLGLVLVSWSWGQILDYPIYSLDGSVFNFSDINQRKPCPNFNISQLLNEDIDVVEYIPYCWSSHLDYVFYIVTAIAIVLFVPVITILRKKIPGLFLKSFMGLEERFLDINEDEPDEDNDPDDMYID